MGNEDKKPEGKISETKRPTLADFINDNERIITVLGVLMALTAYFSSSPIKPFGQIFSVLLLTLTLLVWFELWGQFPSEMGNSTLFWFESIFGLLVFALVGYWVVSIGCIFPQMVFLISFLLISSFISYLMKRFDIFNRFFKAEPGQKRILRIFLGVLILLISYLVGVFVVAVLIYKTYTPFTEYLISLGCSLP